MVQIIIIILYFAVTVLIGVLSSKKSKSSASFHGAAMGMFAIVAASAGEWLGGTATTGVSEYGFNFGLSGAWYTIANGIGVMFLALCFAKLYRSLNTVTVPGIIDGWREKLIDKNVEGMRLDYIWCSRRKEVFSSRVVFNGMKEPVVSDHFGVMIQVKE